MLTVHQLKKSFNLQLLFENVTFSVNPGDRIGLVGENGCGKTTLLRILAGLEQPSAGIVSHLPGLRIGYLPQKQLELSGLENQGDLTIADLLGDSKVLEMELTTIATELAKSKGDTSYQAHLEARYDELIRRIQFVETGRNAAILSGLGLSEIDQTLPASLLSGGQKTRLGLALLLLNDPQLLLLDEPTNHLDIPMLEWLEAWINASACGILVVSHDRAFLDHTVTQILEMDSKKHSVSHYAGNYSAYIEQRQTEIEKQWSAFRDQQQEIHQIKQDILRTKGQAVYTERQASSIRIGGPDMKLKGYKDYQHGIAKKVAKKAKAREKKLERYLEDEDRIEKPQQGWQMHMGFSETPHLGSAVIRLKDLSIGYHPQNPLLKNIHLDVRAGRRIVLTGANGAGKTTLLKTIMNQLPPLGGEIEIGPSVHLGYLTQDQSDLDPAMTAVECVQPFFNNQTEARSFLAYYLFTGEEPLKPVANLSHGQRVRLMLARLVAQQSNCLLLDEPINHLDISSRSQFEEALHQFEGTILAVVHDRYFIERFAEEIWWVEGGNIRVQMVN